MLLVREGKREKERERKRKREKERERERRHKRKSVGGREKETEKERDGKERVRGREGNVIDLLFPSSPFSLFIITSCLLKTLLYAN